MYYSYPFVEEMMPLWYIFIFIFGLCVGSFLNVCIWRMPRGESIVFTPSHCPNCNHKIKWYENIPVLSWLLLQGRCSKCKTPISLRYLAIEILSGVLILVDWWRVVEWHQPLSLFLLYLLATILFIVTFFVDLKYKIIPNRLTYSVIIIGLLLALFFPQTMGINTSYEAFINSVLGLTVAGGALAVVLMIGKLILKKDVLGWGDVKFIAAVGACFGFYPAVWFFCILTGSILGTITGLIIICFGRGQWSTALPFGTFLSIAGYLWILYGIEITTYYFNCIGFAF
jgi:leader peptidase (prepilin peptidase) / N-methyltransferase